MSSLDPISKRFAVVRPYPSSIRRRVFGFLEGLGYVNSEAVPVGTPDAEACSWVERHTMDLLLLPYHKHKASDGSWVNGLGVARKLGPAFLEREVPILMPIDEFTFASSFEREYAEALATAPGLTDRIVVMRECEIGEASIAKSIAAIAGSDPAPHPS